MLAGFHAALGTIQFTETVNHKTRRYGRNDAKRYLQCRIVSTFRAAMIYRTARPALPETPPIQHSSGGAVSPLTNECHRSKWRCRNGPVQLWK
jgi:hypothetical protein